MQPIAGSLLIASATLADPNFARCVILVVDSDANGSLGLVLNRPTDTPVGEVLDQWQDMTTEPDVLFRGGPVELNAALALGSARAAPPPSGWQPLTGSLGLVDLDSSPDFFLGRLAALRVYAGYTGWGANQLADEIEVGSWHVVPATETDLFSSAPDRLWGDVLRRQPPPLSMLATLPADANLN
ncbi:MAG: YqgE/AlgH family protein [Marmoricola sp.]|nr:YqgE/AlgH family protein [Marmoricola sp.]